MVDPTALNNKMNGGSAEDKESKNLRAFVFSLLGALAGAAACVIVDYFVGNITGLVYLFVGMASYAFYLYFVERKDQKRIHLLWIAVSCVLATALAVFVDCMILYAPHIQDPDMNFFEKTMELYRINVSSNGFNSYKHLYSDQGFQLDMSLLAFHAVCALMSIVGLALSWVFVKYATKAWEKKHGQKNADYSYASRKKKAKKKR